MFDNKTVVITGGANGIGCYFAKECLQANAQVWVLDIDKQALDQLTVTAKKYNWKFHGIVCDITNKQDIKNLSQNILKSSQKIDYWLNNAGIQGTSPFSELNDDQFSRVLEINVLAVINCTRIALRIMEQQSHGTIINIASVAGHIPAPYLTAYCTSKHAVVGFTRSLQAELQLNFSPVQLVLASPGFVDTKIINRGKNMGFPEWLTPVLAKPEKVANEIISGLKRGKKEIYPTVNGKMMLQMYKLFPQTTIKSSRILLTKNLKDFLLNQFRHPERSEGSR